MLVGSGLSGKQSYESIAIYKLDMKEQKIEEVGNYRFLKSHPLGEGATGKVYYGQDKQGKKVAVKSIDINKITKGI